MTMKYNSINLGGDGNGFFIKVSRGNKMVWILPIFLELVKVGNDSKNQKCLKKKANAMLVNFENSK